MLHHISYANFDIIMDLDYRNKKELYLEWASMMVKYLIIQTKYRNLNESISRRW